MVLKITVETPNSLSTKFNRKRDLLDLLKTIHTITNNIYQIVHIDKFEYQSGVPQYGLYYDFVFSYGDDYIKLPKNKDTQRYMKLSYKIWNEIIRPDWKMEKDEFSFYYSLYIKRYTGENKILNMK